MKKLLVVSAVLFAVASISTVATAQKCASSQKHEMTVSLTQDTQQEVETMDIVDTAAGNEIFSTLVAAVKAADLVEALKSEGPFTVFAPTNEAFEKLPEGTVASLLEPENKEKLIAILKYHVVSGKVMAGDVVKLDSAETLQGTSVAIAVEEGTVMIDKAKVIKADVECSNGVVHVIDTVILPKSE
jgi:uncharacterized surface protein with fasciclin (FAS1) repeats